MSRVLVPGRGEGMLLRLAEPLSFWGGVNPLTGIINDPRHPQQGESVAGTVLALETRGSSSSSSVLLELLARTRAPAAILLAEVAAILALGAVVARELGWTPPPVLELGREAIAALIPGRWRVEDDRFDKI